MAQMFTRDKLYTLIQEKQPNICGVCVLQHGEQIYSETWNGNQITDCAHIMSATKSVMALLIGIAIDRGYIRGVDEIDVQTKRRTMKAVIYIHGKGGTKEEAKHYEVLFPEYKVVWL